MALISNIILSAPILLTTASHITYTLIIGANISRRLKYAIVTTAAYPPFI